MTVPDFGQLGTTVNASADLLRICGAHEAASFSTELGNFRAASVAIRYPHRPSSDSHERGRDQVEQHDTTPHHTRRQPFWRACRKAPPSPRRGRALHRF